MFLHSIICSGEANHLGVFCRPIFVLCRPHRLHGMFRTVSPTLAGLIPLFGCSAGFLALDEDGGSVMCVSGGGGITTGTYDGDGG